MVTLLLLLLSQPPAEKPPDAAALCREADRHMVAYAKAIERLEFRETLTNYKDGKVTHISQSTYCLLPGGFISVTRTLFPSDGDYYPKSLPSVRILRSRGDHFEEFQLGAIREIQESKELTLGDLTKRYEWYGANGKYLDLTAEKGAEPVIAGANHSLYQMFGGFPTLWYSYPKFICTDYIRLNSVRHDGDKLHLEYSTQQSDPPMPWLPTKGSMTLLKNQFWHVQDAESFSARSQDRDTFSIRYTTFENIPVPLTIERMSHMGGPGIKSITQCRVNRMADESLLSLTSFGQAEQELAPPLGYPVKTEASHAGLPWVWVAIAVVVVILLAVISHYRRRIPTH